MPSLLIVAIALSALAAIVADWRETRPPLFKLLKPLTTVLIMVLALMAPDSGYRNWIIAALLLSLLGDVALMWESDGAFITGLSSFLIAHLLLLPALLGGVAMVLPPWPGWLLLAYALAFSAVLLPRAPAPLRIPVFVYGAVLCAMALAALLRWQQRGDEAARYALIGALLFVLSDSALGARRFIGHYRGAQGLILASYWAAIGCIAWSAWL